MKKITVLLTLLLSLFGFSQTYITNVTVVDVEKQKLIPNQTVTIVNDLIANIQTATKAKIPGNANIINGSGKYLSPGLTDAHVHFFQNGGLYARPDAINLRQHVPYANEIDYSKNNMETNLKRYLSCGITNLIDVGSTHNFLKLRDSYKTRKDVPSVYMSGPLLTTYLPAAFKDLKDDSPFELVQSVDQAKKLVQDQLAHHPDLIKIWYIVQADKNNTVENVARKHLPVIKAIIETAHQGNVKVAVHATERITAQLAVESGVDFLVHNIEDELLKPDFIQLMKTKKTILCPTLIAASGYDNTFGQKLDFNLHDFIKSDAYQLGTLTDLQHLPDTALINGYKEYTNAPGNVAQSKNTETICMTNLKKLSDAGVLIATGTDAGNIGTLHASSYLRELRMMQKSGMNSWQIITASTINGAKVVNKENEFGSISVGKKANLILLNGNPITDIENLANIEQVFLNGTAYKPQFLIPDTPENLAQRQLNAYNFRNIEAFLEPYANDVEIYIYPDKLEYKGKETMRKQYADMFQRVPNLHCELKERIVQGNIVIDKERVQFGNQFVEAVAIYHIENGKIKKVYFID